MFHGCDDGIPVLIDLAFGVKHNLFIQIVDRGTDNEKQRRLAIQNVK